MLGEWINARAYLLAHWDVAEEWLDNLNASDGSACFVHSASDYRTHATGFRMEVASACFRAMCYSRHTPDGPRMNCLKMLNQTIARLDKSHVTLWDRALFRFRNWKNPIEVARDPVRVAEDKVLQAV